MPDDDVRHGVIGQARVDLIERIARLWRGDPPLDGSDGAGWLKIALYGNAEDMRRLDAQLHAIENGI